MRQNMYPAQSGHNIKQCQSFDEINKPQMLHKMTLQHVDTGHEYMTLDDPVTQRLISAPNITPSYYPNMTLEMIGKRPVYSVRQCEYNIPDIILKNKGNLLTRDFTGLQPVWSGTSM